LLQRLNSAGGCADHYQIAMGHKESSSAEMFSDTVEIAGSGLHKLLRWSGRQYSK
jgi:hypothetical protein